jgi:hypothetical protein
MFISDLYYQHAAIDAMDLEGGINLGGSITNYTYDLSQFYTVSQSGPNGSYAGQGGVTIDLSSFGASFVALGL